MVKLTSPLMSARASGQFAKNLTFQARGSKNVCRRFHYPKKQPTGEQLAQRYIIGLLTARWQTMTAGEQATWNLAAKEYQEKFKTPMTGFNYWIKTASSDLPTYYGMIAFYPFNEGSGIEAKDYSGNGLNLRLNSVAPATLPEWVNNQNKKYGKCLRGDGTRKWCSCAWPTVGNFYDEMTFFVWCKFNAKDGANRQIFNQSSLWNLYKTSTELVSCAIYLNGVISPLSFASSKWIAGDWMCIAMTYKNDGTSLNQRMFLNGRIVSWITKTGVCTHTTGTQYVLSSSTTGNLLNGEVDNLLFLKRKMSDEEVFKVFQIMQAGKERQQLP